MIEKPEVVYKDHDDRTSNIDELTTMLNVRRCVFQLVDAVNRIDTALEVPVRDHAEDHKTMDEVVVCLTKQEIRDLLDGYTGNAKLRKAWEAMK